MTEFNLKDLDDIQIPEHLEHRLAAQIDAWAEAESAQSKRRPIGLPRRAAWTSVAAAVIIAAGLTWHFIQPSEQNLAVGEITDPEIAQREAERALQLLAVNLQKGMDGVTQAEELLSSHH